MYQVGDMIVYGNEGVCRVISVGKPGISGVSKEKLYYTLEPQYCDGLIYAPVDTPVHTRPVMSREEAEDLIRSLPEIQAEQQTEHLNVRLLGDHYKELMRSYEKEDIVRLIKEIYFRRETALARGGKSSQVDERYMKRAEDLLYGEISVSLDIPRDQVDAHIQKTMQTRMESAG